MADFNAQPHLGIETPPSVPVFHIVVVDNNRHSQHVGVGNGILLDHDTFGGIIVINAHGIDFGGRYKSNDCHVYLPHTGRYHKAEADEAWINWDADYAHIRLTKVDLSSYPHVTQKISGFNKYEKIAVVGHKDGIDNQRPVVTPGLVAKWKSHSGVTLPSLKEMWDVEKKWFVSRSEKSILYKNYIHFFTSNREAIIPTMSGSAFVDQQGNLAGMLSKGGRNVGLAIPSSVFMNHNIPWRPQVGITCPRNPGNP